MPLINCTKNSQIAGDVEVAGSWLSRLKGLMGRSSLTSGHCLILSPCNSIHTCFMRFNIDVLFVDKQGAIVYLIKDIPPYKFSTIVKKSKYVVELPAGTIDQTGTSVNDRLNISEVI